MKLSSVVCYLLFVALASADKRIFNGKDTSRNETKYYAFITCNEKKCGGSIVTANRIITAAHCLEHCEPKDITIYTGMISLLNNTNTSTYKAKKFHLHPNYQPIQNDFDIAVIDVDGYISFNPLVGNIDVAESSPHVHGSITCFGFTDPPCGSTLKKVVNKITKIEGGLLILHPGNSYATAFDAGAPCIFNGKLSAIISTLVRRNDVVTESEAVDLTSPEITKFLKQHL